MKNLNRSHYTEQELQIMTEGAATKWSTAKLSRRYARQFNRSASGVYKKIKEIRENRQAVPVPTVIIAQSNPQPVQTNLDLKTPVARFEIKSVEMFDNYIKLNF